MGALAVGGRDAFSRGDGEGAEIGRENGGRELISRGWEPRTAMGLRFWDSLRRRQGGLVPAVVCDLWPVVRFCMRIGIMEPGTWPVVGGCGGLPTVGCFLRTLMWIALIVAAGVGDSFLAEWGGGIRMSATARGKRWRERACSFPRGQEANFRRGVINPCDGLAAPLGLKRPSPCVPLPPSRPMS